MAKTLISDDHWAVIAPLLPPARPRPKGGRPPIPDRAALTGILFVLRTGLPQEMGCGSGMSCWRRLRDWQAAGVWAGLHIEGCNAYHWVFHADEAVVHTASPTRGAVVVLATMDGHRPAVWISDRYTAQQGHAVTHQTCLAHLARDVAYAVEASDDAVPWRLQFWLRSVFALAERVADLAATTLAAKRRSLDRQLDAVLATPTRCDLMHDLQAKIGRARDQLLVFLDHPGRGAPTNNGSERLLRPAVVQRKMTNGYRTL